METPTLVDYPSEQSSRRLTQKGTLRIEVVRSSKKKVKSRRGGRRVAAYKFIMPARGMMQVMGPEFAALRHLHRLRRFQEVCYDPVEIARYEVVKESVHIKPAIPAIKRDSLHKPRFWGSL